MIYAPKYFAGIIHLYRTSWRRIIRGDSYDRVMGILTFINFLMLLPAFFGLIAYEVKG